MTDKWISIQRAADLLGTSYHYVHWLIRHGKLDMVTVGGSDRRAFREVRLSDVLQYMRTRSRTRSGRPSITSLRKETPYA